MSQPITRRTILLAGAAVGLRPANAAPSRTVGFLVMDRRANWEQRLPLFTEGMRALGYVEGRDFAFEPRFASDEAELAHHAMDLVKLEPAVILASASVAIRALLKLTATIPVVSTGTGDPVGAGFAQSLARPGRNFTGLSNANVNLDGKLLEYMARIVPRGSLVALLYSPDSASGAGHRSVAADAARSLGVALREFPVHSAADIESAFRAMRPAKVAGAIVPADSITVVHAKLIADQALKERLPAISQNDSFARAGLLLSYGSDRLANLRIVARFVDRIFRGAKAGELPIEQPTELVLTVNQRTAQKIGVNVPGDLLIGARLLTD